MYSVDANLFPPARTAEEELLKSIVDGLKCAGRLAKLVQATALFSLIKCTEVTLNWLRIDQDFMAGRIVLPIPPPNHQVKTLREYVGMVRDIVQYAAIPIGLIAAYSRQISLSGGMTGLVLPFSKTVVQTFSIEARALLLLREVLVVIEQISTPQHNYGRMLRAAALATSLALAFLHYGVASLLFGLAADAIAVTAFVLTKMRRHEPYADLSYR